MQRSIAFLCGVDRPSGEYHFDIIELLRPFASKMFVLIIGSNRFPLASHADVMID